MPIYGDYHGDFQNPNNSSWDQIQASLEIFLPSYQPLPSDSLDELSYRSGTVQKLKNPYIQPPISPIQIQRFLPDAETGEDDWNAHEVDGALELAEEGVNRPPPKPPHLQLHAEAFIGAEDAVARNRNGGTQDDEAVALTNGGGDVIDVDDKASCAEVGASVRGKCTSSTVCGKNNSRDGRRRRNAVEIAEANRTRSLGDGGEQETTSGAEDGAIAETGRRTSLTFEDGEAMEKNGTGRLLMEAEATRTELFGDWGATQWLAEHNEKARKVPSPPWLELERAARPFSATVRAASIAGFVSGRFWKKGEGCTTNVSLTCSSKGGLLLLKGPNSFGPNS
ncbi:hypothetical protein PIB30_081630 [Stylosanthes scabra]|uniref:Uncharacterized protein n=1 Tax=Stylosanthes scabra TaxID=79078 RepID=A0ABU6ZQB6_9FABA|nr:hypothetical protein [Stylosanthes scabra]